MCLLKNLLGSLPIQEVEFGIELVPGTTLILIASYRMAPTKLKKVKISIARVIR